MSSVRTGLRGWIALTGTPGVGKSTTADKLRLSGIPHVNLADFAHVHDLVEGMDRVRTSAIVDPKKVGKELKRYTQPDATLLLEGHWAHEVPGVVGVIVLRLRPSQIRARLQARGWPPAKIDENVEAEAMDLILQEAVAAAGKAKVWEVDTTGHGPDAVAAQVFKLIRAKAVDRKRWSPGHVDWSQELLDSTPRNA